MMTQEQQRVAIAKWRGCQYKQVYNMPNYPLDLNAMHEAENNLNDSLRRRFILDLVSIICPTAKEWVWSAKEMFQFTNATASQRSEALCRTLWPERFE